MGEFGLDFTPEDAEILTSSIGRMPPFPEVVETLRRLFVPIRFPLHVLQMTGLYIGQMSPSSFITNCANFQAADEMRRVQRFAYWTKVLANAHGEDLAATSAARTPWEEAPEWQPLREALERLLATHDWGESFTALNLALKPAIDTLLNRQFAELARSNEDDFLALLLSNLQRDSKRSQDWTAALVRYALEHRPEVREVLTGWLETWQPRALRAVESLAPVFESAPRPASTRGAVRPPFGVAVENGSATTLGEKRTPSPRTVAVAERSSQRPGMRNDSLRAVTPASRNRAAAHSKACWFTAEPVGRPPKRSVSVSRSPTITSLLPPVISCAANALICSMSHCHPASGSPSLSGAGSSTAATWSSWSIPPYTPTPVVDAAWRPRFASIFVSKVELAERATTTPIAE